MIMDVAIHNFISRPRIMGDSPSESCRQILKLKFTNEVIDALNINNILCHKNFSLY